MIGPQGSTGPYGPTGPTGHAGPRGATGATGITERKVEFPGPEGRCVARSSQGDDTVEIWAKAISLVNWTISVTPILDMVLVRDGQMVPMHTWNQAIVYGLEPEGLALVASSLFIHHEVAVSSQEEIVAMFVIAKKEVMKMMATICAELLLSHVSREEMGEAWDDANALRIMIG